MVRRIHDALLGNLNMANGGEGLVGCVRRHDRALAGLHRLTWLIVAAIVTSGIASVIAILVRGGM